MSASTTELASAVPGTAGPVRWVRDTLESGRQALLLMLRSRILLALLAISAAVAVGFALVARRVAPHVPGDEFCGIVTYMVYFQFGLPFAVLYLGVAAVHTEIADRTTAFLFVRPLRRSSLLLARWLAVVLLGGVLAGGAMALLHLALAIPALPWSRGLGPDPRILGAFVVAAVPSVAAYAAVGVCFGALFRRPLILGIAFVVGWEFLVSHAPPQAGVRQLTVADPVRRLLVHWIEPRGELRDVLVRDLNPFWLEPGQLGNPLGSLAGFTAFFLAVAVLIYSRREYDSRSSE